MLLYERDKIGGRVAGQGRLTEVRVGGNEVVGGRVQVGEIATAATGDRDLLADPFGMFEYDYLAAAFAGLDRTEETGCPAADDNHICLMHAQAYHAVGKAQEKGQRPLWFAALCLLPSAFCLRLSGSFRLGRGVQLPRLDNKFFVIVGAVAVYVDADFDLVLLAVVHVAGIKRQAILTAQERIDRFENSRDFPWESVGVVGPAGLFGKSRQRILRLQKVILPGPPVISSTAPSRSPYFLKNILPVPIM